MYTSTATANNVKNIAFNGNQVIIYFKQPMKGINFLNIVFDDVYELLIKTPINWPYELGTQEQFRLLEEMIQHYSELEDYAKCKKLQEIKETLE